MTDVVTILAENLKEFREMEGINQFDFAEDCGISTSSMSLIERGMQNVTLGTLELIAARVGRSVADLLSPNLGNTYYLIESKVYIEGVAATTYGIGVIHDFRQICAMPDISPDCEKIEQLVCLCNKLRLSPVHLPYIAEDFCFD